MGHIIIETDDSYMRLRQSNDCFVVATQPPRVASHGWCYLPRTAPHTPRPIRSYHDALASIRKTRWTIRIDRITLGRRS